ncbi:hypothetical protein VFPPC_16957 [Pochonia chlamydosporia 170]|uniref:Uncharacterized protein n=1 Tax=Pochonia chlamydosporia 170 TaxID=1380566 RepID=A0A179F0G4_METCM|nr:hypothetical protein VFPPC_16957 [Pochonia chlamydosporia 170]OAQ58583.1 hypothetical protein VFPPC_16957 [Pochonia chlamydosporia 170]
MGQLLVTRREAARDWMPVHTARWQTNKERRRFCGRVESSGALVNARDDGNPVHAHSMFSSQSRPTRLQIARTNLILQHQIRLTQLRDGEMEKAKFTIRALKSGNQPKRTMPEARIWTMLGLINIALGPSQDRGGRYRGHDHDQRMMIED